MKRDEVCHYLIDIFTPLGGQPSTSAALSGIQNDHPFGASNSILNSPNPPVSDSAMSSGAYSQPQSVLSSFREMSEVDFFVTQLLCFVVAHVKF